MIGLMDLARPGGGATTRGQHALDPFEPLFPARFAGEEQPLGPHFTAADVRRAISEDRLVLWYQPKVEVSTGRLCGAEALVRLEDREFGLIAPGAFLPSLDAGDLATLTAWVVERAHVDWQRFAAAGRPVRLSVNAPPSTLERSALPALLERLRPDHPFWPGMTIEMTETEIVQRVELIHAVIRQLHAQAVSISIDDFGSGYSSLARLRQIPFAEIKIDRSLIRDCETDESIRIFLKAIRDFAHFHHARVVAEGVETREEFTAIADIGIDEVQGFFIARPMPVDEFLRAAHGFA